MGKAENLVVVMGASAALGDRHENLKNRFFLQVENNLKILKGLPKIQLVPAAVRSFVSTQERVLLDLFVLPLRSKLIIFLHGFNDANQWTYMARPGNPYNYGIELSRHESKWFRFMQVLADWSYVFRRYFVRSSESFVMKSANQIVRDPEKWDSYSIGMANVFLENVVWMAKRCEQEKVRCSQLIF